MIKIVEYGPGYSEPEKYMVTCYRCKTKFTCDSSDFHTVTVAQSIMDNAVRCPWCGRECTGWYETDIFVKLND